MILLRYRHAYFEISVYLSVKVRKTDNFHKNRVLSENDNFDFVSFFFKVREELHIEESHANIFLAYEIRKILVF